MPLILLIAILISFNAPTDNLQSSCAEFDQLNTQVRDRLINKQAAQEKIRTLIPKIKEYFYASGGKSCEPGDWVFPLEGYGPKAIGGSNGSGYIASRYDFFDGNKHLGHPAHDIFINDKNQDSI